MKRLIVALASVGSLFAGSAQAAKHHVKKTEVTTSTRAAEPGRDVRAGMDAQDNTAVRHDANEVKAEADDAAENASEDARQTGRSLKAAAADVGAETKTAVGNAADDVGTATSKVGDKLAGAGDEVAGRDAANAKGELARGEVRNTLTTNPLGLFSGEGLNLMYSRPFARKISGVAGANYSRTNAGDGAVTEYGLTVGGDYFLIGQHNEGLRVGPRVQLAGGSSSVGRNTLVGEVSLAGELGYNWIANNGLTAGAGAGLAGRLGGALDTQNDNQNDSAGRGRVNPYGRLNIGYSW